VSCNVNTICEGAAGRMILLGGPIPGTGP